MYIFFWLVYHVETTFCGDVFIFYNTFNFFALAQVCLMFIIRNWSCFLSHHCLDVSFLYRSNIFSFIAFQQTCRAQQNAHGHTQFLCILLFILFYLYFFHVLLLLSFVDIFFVLIFILFQKSSKDSAQHLSMLHLLLFYYQNFLFLANTW